MVQSESRQEKTPVARVFFEKAIKSIKEMFYPRPKFRIFAELLFNYSMPRGVIGNTSDSGSEESRFEP